MWWERSKRFLKGRSTRFTSSAPSMGRVLVTNDEGQRQRARAWYQDGRAFPGVIWWPQVDYVGKTPGDFLKAFEALAEQENPFSPYPILYLIAKRR
jgi:hypothetical protein